MGGLFLYTRLLCWNIICDEFLRVFVLLQYLLYGCKCYCCWRRCCCCCCCRLPLTLLLWLLPAYGQRHTANTIFSFRFFVGLVWFGRARLAWWGCRSVSFGCTNDCRFHKCLTFNGITTTHHVFSIIWKSASRQAHQCSKLWKYREYQARNIVSAEQSKRTRTVLWIRETNPNAISM